MKLHKLLLMSAMVVGLVSCGSIRKSTAYSVGISTEIAQYPTVADLDVKAKVEKTITWSWGLFKSENLSLAKSNLMADVLKEAGADVLLEPQYTYTKESFGERTLTITGFPATFKNFRKATDEDLKALKVIYADPKGETETVYNLAKPCKKNKRFLGIF